MKTIKLEVEAKIDHSMTEFIVCPYCGNEMYDCHEYEDYGENVKCENCEKKFVIERDTTITYTTYKK